MHKETISLRQSVCVLTMFIFGSSVILGATYEAEQDSWISLLLSLVIIIPVFMIYARIIKIYPQKDLYDIIEEVFGKIVGKIIIALITWYAIHLAALVLQNFSQFINVVVLPNTPQLASMILLILIAGYLAKSGVETLGKWSIVVFSIAIFVVLITFILSISYMNFSNILPIMNHSTKVIMSSSFKTFSFPFGETILFLTMAGSLKKGASTYKVYLFSALIGAFILLAIIIRNLEVLGSPMIEGSYFPSYTAVRIITIGKFLSRIEGSISMNFFLAGVTKITVCVIAASKGFAKLFNIQEYKHVIMPTGLFILAISSILYKNIMQMIEFIDVYYIYSIPFQLVIPFVLWIFAEIHNRKANKKEPMLS